MNEDLTTSPIIKKPQEKLTSFGEVIEEVLDGKKIHRIEWGDKEYYGILYKEVLMLHKPDGKLYQWIVSFGDISAKDWMVLPEVN